MEVLTNENNVITLFLRTGHINGAVSLTGNVPEYLEPYKYKLENAEIVENPDYVPPDTLSPLKMAKIEESKTKLAEWLANNPLLYSDGKYYSVTEEKQSLLNGNLASYERAESMGIDYDLKWNATEQPCEPRSYTDLLTLSLNIAAYVAPKVSKQQLLEVQIRNCETVEELDTIVINYDEEK